MSTQTQTKTSTSEGWIKRSEREPGKEDGLCRLGFYYQNGDWSEYTYDCRRAGAPVNDKEYTHWRSIYLDPPPPRERMQAEKDKFEARLWIAHHFTADECGPWFSALEKLALSAVHAERREVSRLLGGYFTNPNWGHECCTHKGLVALRARLDEQGGAK